MVLSPKTGLGRFLLVVIVITTISYLVLNLVSFGGTPWISTTVEDITFGLWTVCDTSSTGSCSQWSDSTYASNVTTIVFSGGKPTYIVTSQALEIISLIFYIFAAGLIFVGVLDLDAAPYEFMFMGASGLLFISIVFISATLGVMSVQGRQDRLAAYLNWAWWNGLAGLIVTIICFVSLLALLADMKLSPRNREKGPIKKKPKLFSKSKDVLVGPQAAPISMMGSGSTMTAPIPIGPPVVPPYPLPVMEPPPFSSSPLDYNNYLGYNNPNFDNYYPLADQNNLNGYYSNPPLTYGGQYPWDEYSNDQTPSPMISALAREYVQRANDAQYERELIGSYGESFSQPYFTNTYV